MWPCDADRTFDMKHFIGTALEQLISPARLRYEEDDACTRQRVLVRANIAVNRSREAKYKVGAALAVNNRECTKTRERQVSD